MKKQKSNFPFFQKGSKRSPSGKKKDQPEEECDNDDDLEVKTHKKKEGKMKELKKGSKK